jgi:hypothetical protein
VGAWGKHSADVEKTKEGIEAHVVREKFLKSQKLLRTANPIGFAQKK